MENNLTLEEEAEQLEALRRVVIALQAKGFKIKIGDGKEIHEWN